MNIAAFTETVGTDRAYGMAILMRGSKEIARTPCSLFPMSWFGVLQLQARLGDLVEVRLGSPLNRTERYYMATANHNGFVTGYCTEVMWSPKKRSRAKRR